MPYITKRTPSTRPEDTPIGKVMGHLSEILEYLRWEGYAGIVDGLFPIDIFPLDIVQNTLIELCRLLYGLLYQQAYNKGADRGNEINKQIMGWLDDVKNQAFAKVDEAKAYIENNLVKPIERKLEVANSKLDELNKVIDTAKRMVLRHQELIDFLDRRVTTLEARGTEGIIPLLKEKEVL